MQFFGGSSGPPLPAAPPGTTTGLARNNANMLYVFNRSGVCLLYREWQRPLRTLDAQQDQKLLLGLLFSLRSFTAKMDPTSVDKGNLGAPLLPGQGCSFHSFCTNTYKLSFMECPSGIKIILITHPKTGDLRESLRHIYNIYVNYIMKNPFYVPGSSIKMTTGVLWCCCDWLHHFAFPCSVTLFNIPILRERQRDLLSVNPFLPAGDTGESSCVWASL